MMTLTEHDLEFLLAQERQHPGAAPAPGSRQQQLLLGLVEADNLEAALGFVWGRMDDPDPALWVLIQRLIQQLLMDRGLSSTLRRFRPLLDADAELAVFHQRVAGDFLYWLYLHKEKLAQRPERTTPTRFFHRLCKNLLVDQIRARYRETSEGWQPREESLDGEGAGSDADPAHRLADLRQDPDDGSDPFQDLYIEVMDGPERVRALARVRLEIDAVERAARAFLAWLRQQPVASKHRHRTPPDWALVLLCCVRSALNPTGLRPTHVDPERLPNVDNLLRQLGLVVDLNRYPDYRATLIGQWLFNHPHGAPGGLGLGQDRRAVLAAWAALQILADIARANYHYDSDVYRKPVPS